jgi:hypothetical protein
MSSQPSTNRCPNCGAPLQKDQQAINCDYCGKPKTVPARVVALSAPKLPQEPKIIKTNAGWYFLVSILMAIIGFNVEPDSNWYNALVLLWFTFFSASMFSLVWFVVRRIWRAL